ncbi:Protein SHI RELATED SEQUENCE 6 [Zea mays]|uniref:Protein SHI RELATED SEQUENCE 6 n=1 Tax=Zea mays TaxID=4577 RepID=A0A1D6M313_MAIZE|nr:Protein SHI RELATED SEQUENCE 6 [Zea mays]
MLVVAPAGSFHHQRAAADDPVLPLITAAQRTLVGADGPSGNAKLPVSSAGAIQFWQQEPAAGGSLGKKALAMLDHGRGGSGSGGATCQDCGNQAKKGCAHSRCRTCCNSRGFECDTHVKSTWVPAARRWERLQLAGGAGAGATASPPSLAPTTTKRPRLACPTPTRTTNSRASTSNATTPRSFDTSSSHQDASFKDSLPRQVRGPAVFRCVRVTSVDDGGGGGTNGEVAYQAAVTINGHLFRGLLYDHGAEDAVMPTASDLNLRSTRAPRSSSAAWATVTHHELI